MNPVVSIANFMIDLFNVTSDQGEGIAVMASIIITLAGVAAISCGVLWTLDKLNIISLD